MTHLVIREHDHGTRRTSRVPGAGTPPPELAGRDDLRELVRVAVERVRRGMSAKSVILVGLRGVGKTVLLDRMREDAESGGLQTLHIEAPEGRSLPALIAPQLRILLLKLSRNEQARKLAQCAMRALSGFAKGLKLKYQDIEVGVDLAPEAGLADNGDLEQDLQALLEAVGTATQKAGTALIIFIDEMQYVAEEELAALIMVLQSRLWTKVFSGSLRSTYSGRKEISARDGRAGARSTSLRRHCNVFEARPHFVGSNAQSAHCQGDDLESKSRRHGIYRAAVRSIHAPNHAWR